jgi:hypothetical protein
MQILLCRLPCRIFHTKADRIIFRIAVNSKPLFLREIQGTVREENIGFLVDHILHALQHNAKTFQPVIFRLLNRQLLCQRRRHFAPERFKIFLLPRRAQPLGELIPAPETARVDGLFCISTIVPTPDGYGTFDTGDCRVEGYPDSEAAAALRSAMSEISVQRYYRLPTSLLSRFTQNENYVTVWWIPEDGQKHDLYLNWDEGFIYDDANRAVAYKIDGDAQQAFSQLCAVISEYGTYTR